MRHGARHYRRKMQALFPEARLVLCAHRASGMTDSKVLWDGHEVTGHSAAQAWRRAFEEAKRTLWETAVGSL